MPEGISAYRPIADLTDNSAVAGLVEQLDQIWRQRFGVNESVCMGICDKSTVSSEYPLEHKLLTVGLS